MSGRLYTPSRENPAVLEARTAGRDVVLSRINAVLEAAINSGNRSHLLLLGPRGAGKSHALEVALYRAQSILADSGARVIRLPEDALGILSATDVMIEALRAGSASDSAIIEALDNRHRSGDVERIVAGEFGNNLLVLTIENLDRVMHQLREPGQDDLRGWVERNNVLVLATAPQRFDAIQNRDAPWFGAFEQLPLAPLTVDEGVELVQRLLEQHGQGDAAAALSTPKSRTRLEAIHHLAGGSPRIWSIFAGVVDLANLDDLVPAVEALLEELVPYYQQVLWDLSPTEQRIIDTVARLGSALTVSQIAERSGLEVGTTATTLRRLAKVGWVAARKSSGLDGRQSWYELSEPLLRHHLQYRDGRSKELPLIVEIIRAWFDRAHRSQMLIEGDPSSTESRYLGTSLLADPHHLFHDSYANRSIADLRVEAMLWKSGDHELGSVQLGNLVLGLIDELPNDLDDEELADLLGEQLRSARLPDGDLATPMLALVETCWNGHRDAQRAVGRLEDLATNSTGIPRLDLAIRSELSYWMREMGRVDDALTEYEAVLADQADVLGATHPDTLTTRHNYARTLCEAGRIDDALTEYNEIVNLSGNPTAALVAAARLAASSGRLKPPGAQSPELSSDLAELLRRVGFEDDAAAFEALPVEIRSLIERDGSEDGVA